ncbi:MAG: response regulator transcription factor [Bacteroidota bacterium]
MAKILLAEDDDTLGYVLKSYLELKGFEVTWAKDGAEGLAAFAKSKFDLGLLDVMMPQMDGFTLAEKLKLQQDQLPIIFLTARALKVDKLKGFNLGADDYIVKPIDEEELVARINAVLRRTQRGTQEATLFSIGAYTFDVKNQKLSLGDNDQYLTERETQILHLLCQHKGNLLSRKLVLQTLWGKSDYFNRRSMDVFISKLRKYLSQDERIQITNVHGSGFILSD